MLDFCLINQPAFTIIKNFEGFNPRPYLNSYGTWSIGFRHTRTVHTGMLITTNEAELLLLDDLKIIHKAVNRLVRVPLNDNQFSALLSFTFDVGIMTFERTQMLRLLNRGWYQQVPTQFIRWGISGSAGTPKLPQRRFAESRLWNTPVPIAPILQEDDETTFQNVG